MPRLYKSGAEDCAAKQTAQVSVLIKHILMPRLKMGALWIALLNELIELAC